MIASILWTLVWFAAIFTNMVNLESIIKNKEFGDLEGWSFILGPLLAAVLVVFWFN